MVCVVPIDLAAPKGRLILPQVQVLREILDSDAIGIMVKEREIDEALSNFHRKPALVITDSQVVMSVAGDVPEEIPLTTFSILFARTREILQRLPRGLQPLTTLKTGTGFLLPRPVPITLWPTISAVSRFRAGLPSTRERP